MSTVHRVSTIDADALAALHAQIAELQASRDEWRDRYNREVLGLNNEGDPIGGDPARGLKHAVEDLRAQVLALQSWKESVLAAAGHEPNHRNFRDEGHMNSEAYLRASRDYYKQSALNTAAKLVEAEQRIKAFEEADTSHLPYEKGWQDGRDDAWRAYNAIPHSQPQPLGGSDNG